MHDILQQILYFFGRGFCHQYPERSLEAGGLFFAVCSRDTGIYLGFILTLAIVLILYIRTHSKPAALLPLWAVVVSVVLTVPIVIDGTSSYLGLRESSNLLRYVTGYLCGTGVALLVSGGVLSLLPRANHEVCPIDSPLKLLFVLSASSFIGAAFYLGYPTLGVAAPLLTLACQWAAIVLVNLLILSATRLWQRNTSTAPAPATAPTVPSAAAALVPSPAASPTPAAATTTESAAATSAATSTTTAMPIASPTETGPEAAVILPAAINSRRRFILLLLCIVITGIEMALLSLIVGGFGLLFPSYLHP